RQTPAPRLEADETADSMAALIFTDTFGIVGRQLLQAAIDSMQSYAYELKSDTSIQSLLDWANPLGNNLTPNDVAIPNQNHNLSPSIRIQIPPLNYTIQASDTLAGIAKAYSDSDAADPRWTTTPDQLIISNGSARIIQTGIKLILQGK